MRSNTSRRYGRGRYIVVAGPDGTGKTTVADHLRTTVLTDGPVLHLHHRPRVLGGLTAHDGPVTEPHRDPPYPWAVSLGKVLYLFADYLLGWLVRLRPHLRKGGDVLLERGWWDMLVDPARYRLQPHDRLLRILGAVLTSPTTSIILVADSDILAGRTDELDGTELERQVAAWRALSPRLGATMIDTSAPLPHVLRHAAQAIEGLPPDASASAGWIALPHRQSPRWILPRLPSAATINGMRVYTPVTLKGVAGWSAVTVLARLGATGLLPAGPRPRETLEAVADILPPGGTVAIGHGSHSDRHVAMVLDSAGAPVVFTKLVHDARGEAALAAEAAGLRALRPHLPACLHMPALLDEAPRRLVFEAVPWLPRAAPWRLPDEVALGLGRLYAAGERDGLGPSHGDCVPWNLLRTRDAWYLVDWSDATTEAPMFTDLWHYLVQAHALTGRPSRRSILEGMAGRGRVAPAVHAYCQGANLDMHHAREGLIEYLSRSWVRLDPSTEDGRRGQSARKSLLAHLDVQASP